MVVTETSPTNQVTLIGSGLQSITDYPIPDDVHGINLHGNEIRTIEGLSSVSLGRNLRLLDLSSNRIRVIENLDHLVNLTSLNLAGNLISSVGSGLCKLRRLECLDLSFNQISSLEGIQCFNAGSQLKALFLHGNKIDELSRVLPLVESLTTVRSLTFEADRASNPLCRDAGYPSRVWARAPHLSTLDGADAAGVVAAEGRTVAGAIQEEAELAGLLEFLTMDDVDLALNDSSSSSDLLPSRNADADTTSSTSDTQLNIVRENYPKIEAVLSQFRGQPAAPISRRVAVEVRVGKEEEEEEEEKDEGRKKQKPDRRVQISEQDPHAGPTSEESRLANIENQLQQLLQAKQTTPATTTPATTSAGNVDEGTQTNGENKASETGKTIGEIKLKAPHEKPGAGGGSGDGGGSNSGGDDAYLRNLLGQLDEERERRWTTQKKSDDLTAELRDVNEKRAQERKQIEEALTLVRRLQARLDSGKAAQRESEHKVDSLTDANEKMDRDLKASKQREAALQRLLREVQEKANRQNKEKDDRIKILDEELEATSKRAEAATADAEKNRTRTEQLKTLIADKEKEHQESLRGKYSIGSAEIQTLLTKEGDRISETYKMQVDIWRRKYQELEDEFRLALHLEADRFSALQKTAEKRRKENEELNATLADLAGREARASGLVKELSELAKEQKTKITESAKNRQNVQTSLKKRCEAAETALAAAKDRLRAMDELTAAKVQLETKCAALETLTRNIKAEKELWSGELAQQGAALSQDRGRLEAKVEALSAEVASLKKQLERDADSLRIKGKVIDDQTETIQKLKDGLLERDRRIKEINEERAAEAKEASRRIEEETGNRVGAEERIDYLESRKEELKARLATAEDEATTTKAANEKLVQKWKDRSKLIESLEVKVADMKRTWDEKEAALTRQRDAAVAAEEEARAKSAAIDAAFRGQLDQAQAAHARALAEAEAIKNLEIEEARTKLAAAEEEMREILREAADNKAQMQLKVRKLTNAFAELQS